VSLEFVWMKQVVGIEEGDELPGCQSHTRIARSRQTTVVLMYDVTDARIAELRHDGIGVVWRSVVDHDQLEVRVRLIENTPDRVTEEK
jgi:hypothetical protein